MVEGGEEVGGDGFGFARAVDATEFAAALVPVDEGCGLLGVDGEAALDGLGLVVVALDESAGAAVACAFGLGWGEDFVEDCAAVGAAPASAEAAEDFVVADVDEQRGGDLGVLGGEGVAEGLGLLGGAGEAVEQAAEFGVVAAEAVEQHLDGELVGDEFAALHVALGFLAEFRLVADIFAEHVAGGEVEEAGALGELEGLGAFAGAGGSEQDDVSGCVGGGAHRMNPS